MEHVAIKSVIIYIRAIIDFVETQMLKPILKCKAGVKVHVYLS